MTAHLTSGTYLIVSNASSRSFSIHDGDLTGQGSNSKASGVAGIQVTSGTAYLDRVRIRVTNPAGTSTGILVSGSSAVLHAFHLDIQIAAQTPQGLVLREDSTSIITDSDIETTSTATVPLSIAVRIANSQTRVKIRNSSLTSTSLSVSNEAIFLTSAIDVTLDGCRI